MKLLFIGNSATYVHDLPETLSSLAQKCGDHWQTCRLTPGGYTLSQHADFASEQGKSILAELAKGYDIVFLQDNGNCIANDEMREACRAAARALAEKIKESGARLYFYVRPPYKYDAFGRTAFEQCRAFDELFTPLADELGGTCAYVNRAFAAAMQHEGLSLWGPDDAHTGEAGAYLAVCVFFAVLTGRSASALDTVEGVTPAQAQVLGQIADQVVFGGLLPWAE